MLNTLNTMLTNSNVTIVGVNFDEDPREISLSIAQEMGIAFPTLSMEVVSDLGLAAPNVLPTTYILSPDNEVVAKMIGEQTRESLLDQLQSLGLVSEANEARLELLPSPAAINSSLSRVVTDGKGQVYLSWVTREGEMASLRYAKLEGDDWTTPVTISQGNDWFNNWADFPSLLVNDDSMTAHWLRMSADGTFDYDIEAAFYNSESDAWSTGITIHKDGVSAEHGFVSMLAMSEGRTFITWLDGRETVVNNDDGAGSNTEPDEYGAMTLRAGVFDKNGATVSAWELDHRVCDCCQTSSAMSNTGPMVVYRDRSDDEIRDIYITRFEDDAWTEPVAIHNDGWQIAGCPVNGPSIAAQGEQVAVSWFTARDDSPKVKLVLSDDNGKTFSAPILVANETTNGRVGTAILESGHVAVSWMDTKATDAKIMLTLYSAQGQLLETTQVATSKASRRSGFPIIVSAGNDVYVSWTDISDGAQVRVARLSYAYLIRD